MGYVPRYGITTREDLMGQDWEKYLITDDNRMHRMGVVTLQLPLDMYRMPFEGGPEHSMFVWTNINGVESTLFCERIDEDIDNILQIASVNSAAHEQCKPCARGRYTMNVLKPGDGEGVVRRNDFPLKDGEVHYMTSASTIQITEQTGLHYIGYHAVYFPHEIGNGPAVRLQHSLTAQGYFCHRIYECKEIKDLSQLLYDTLATIEVMPDKMMIN
jgi:hypothetical protein